MESFDTPLSGERMPWVDWRPGEPQFGMGKSVIFDFLTHKHLVSDFNLVPTFCDVKEIPRFRLRGSCEDSGLDTYYILQIEGNIIKPLLLGYTSAKIQPTMGSSGQTWQIVDARNGTILASTNLTFTYSQTGQVQSEFLPIGQRKWTFHGTNCRTNSSVAWREMNLHLAVVQPGHFCCGDGTCISSELRCDNNHDCVDASDEMDCQMIQPPNFEYNPNLPPQVMIEKGHKRYFPKTDLEASVDIWEITDIQASASKISLIFLVTISWSDPQFSYNNLGTNKFENDIDMKNSRIWTPTIEIKTLKEKDSIIMEKELNVRREGIAVMSCGMDCLSPNETFKGSENSLVMKIHYQAVFDCSFSNIDKYPFDQEECSFTFYVSGQDNKLTALVPKEINVSSSSSVSQYQVLNWQMNETLLQNGKTGIKVNLSSKTTKVIFHLTFIRSPSRLSC